jgi:YidC/Oxa1 family membrane protein insertase
VTQSNAVFFGPKKRALLRSEYYAAPLIAYDTTLVMPGMCAFCTFQWLVNGLYYLLWFFERIFRDWGLAIICLVLIVRALLHPITKRAQINMSKMSKMGPEIERLKKKHGDNKDELNKAMMQFYRQQGATPILGCLPMFLQMPIWIALYSALQSTFELRQSPFLWGLTWIDDLAHADRAIYFPNAPVKFWFIHFDAINILPLILGVVSFIQAKIMQAQQPPATTPEPLPDSLEYARAPEAIVRALHRAYGSALTLVYLAEIRLKGDQKAPGIESAFTAACARVQVRCVSTREAMLAAYRAGHVGHGAGVAPIGNGHLNAAGHEVLGRIMWEIVARPRTARQ